MEGMTMLTLWNPNRSIHRFSRDFDDLFNVFSAEAQSQSYRPPVDITETKESFLLTADLPGVSEADIALKVHDGVLYLTGKRESVAEAQSNGSNLRERRFGSFSRQFKIGSSVDSERIVASHNNGVLTVTLAKKEEAKPREIPVNG